MSKQKYDEPAPEPAKHHAPAHKGAGKWQVSLENAPTVTVEAHDEDGAWEEYKKQTGITSSWYKPVIEKVP